ncbi:hypothetical protein ACNOYE_01235 [Nannocystaceae bacterium ST9]
MPALSLALVGLFLGPPPPTPDPDRFALHWQAPVACPDAAHVESRIAALLASSPSAGPILEAHAEVVQVDDRYEVELRLHAGDDPPGTRTLADPDCGELAEGVALIIALAVDPDLLASPPEPAGGETGVGGHGEFGQRDPEPIEGGRSLARHEAVHALVRAPIPEVGVAEPEPRPPEPPLVQLGAYALAGVGVRALPGVTARLGAGMLATGDHWRLELGLSGWLPQRIADARYQAWSVELAGCGVPRAGIVEFPICARIEVGGMIGESLGPQGRRAIAPWLAAAPGAGIIVRPRATRGILGLILRVDAVLPLTRPAFATDEGALLLRIDFGAQILAGLELRFDPARRVRKRTRSGSAVAVLGRSAGGQLKVMPGRSE